MRRQTDIRWVSAEDPAELDIVAGHLAARRSGRRLTLAAGLGTLLAVAAALAWAVSLVVA